MMLVPSDFTSKTWSIEFLIEKIKLQIWEKTELECQQKTLQSKILAY